MTRVPEDLPAVTGDPRAFKQIVLNLVSNAIKFTERGGKVTVSAAVEGSRLVLRVADTGVGIAADDLKRVGDPFFQAGKTYQRRHEGTGLGLSIVKSLVGLHGGDDHRAEQDQRRHHRHHRVAAVVHTAGPAARRQYRNADTSGAIRTARTSSSGEETCLDETPGITTSRAVVAAPMRWRSRRRRSAA